MAFLFMGRYNEIVQLKIVQFKTVQYVLVTNRIS